MPFTGTIKPRQGYCYPPLGLEDCLPQYLVLREDATLLPLLTEDLCQESFSLGLSAELKASPGPAAHLSSGLRLEWVNARKGNALLELLTGKLATHTEASLLPKMPEYVSSRASLKKHQGKRIVNT